MAKTKVCDKCDLRKPITEFYMRSDVPRRKNSCKACYNLTRTRRTKRLRNTPEFKRLDRDLHMEYSSLYCKLRVGRQGGCLDCRHYDRGCPVIEYVMGWIKDNPFSEGKHDKDLPTYYHHTEQAGKYADEVRQIWLK